MVTKYTNEKIAHSKVKNFVYAVHLTSFNAEVMLFGKGLVSFTNGNSSASE